LIEVRNQDGARGTVVRMTYDPLGRRTGKTEHDHNGLPEQLTEADGATV